MSIQRVILEKLLESRLIAESSFIAGGSTYSCAFGNYYKDGEKVSREEYFRAKESTSRSSQESDKSDHRNSLDISLEKDPSDKYKSALIKKYLEADDIKGHSQIFHYPTVTVSDDQNEIVLTLSYKNKTGTSQTKSYTYDIRHAMEAPHEVSILKDLEILMSADKSEDTVARLVINYINKNKDKFEKYN